MHTVALASGSNGNAVHVRTADASLLFDVGVSGRRLEARARARGVDLGRVDALLLSHHHGDHVSGAGIVARRFGMPVHASAATWRVAGSRMGEVARRCRFRPGETVAFGRTRVHTLPTPHDAEGSAAFVVESEGVRLGILTDLGHLFPSLLDVFGTLDGAWLESNHDARMLREGPYPAFLQDRIVGPSGHLSNAECVDLVAGAASKRLRFVGLSHLSGACNTPARALAAARPLLERGVAVHLAPRDDASPSVALVA